MGTKGPTSTVVAFGDFRLDVGAGELFDRRTRVRLQEQPLQVLAMLLERPGVTVTREELQQRLWKDGTFVDFDNGLNIAVRKLRTALRDDPEAPRFIETIPKRGYRFIAAVTPVEGTNPAPVQGPEPDTSSHPAPVARVESPRRSGLWWRVLAGSALLVLVLLVVSVAFGWLFRARPATTISSVAILPLQNLSGDGSQEYFADGMTEALITDLAQISSLRVISRTSSMHYKGSTKTLPEIARELNVDAVVEGSVARSGDRVRVTAQLIDAPRDKHLWAGSFENTIPDVLTVQGEMARAIAEQVSAKLTPQEHASLTNVKPVNPAAYEAYLKGRYETNKLTEAGLQKGLDYYRQAIAIDPNYAPAYAGIAYYYAAQSDWALPPKEAMPRAEEAARKAIGLDDSLADGHLLLASVEFAYDWNWPEAQREYKRAIELSPNSAVAHQYYGSALVWAGHADEGIAEGKKAVSLDPVSIEALRLLGDDYYFAHRYEEAIKQLREALQIEPEYWFAHMSLGRAYAATGDLVAAEAELQSAVRLEPRIPEPLALLGNVAGRARDTGKTRDILRELRARTQQSYVSPYFFVLLYTGLGDRTSAMEWLEKSYEARSIYITWLQTDPVLDTLRGEPKFNRIVDAASVR